MGRTNDFTMSNSQGLQAPTSNPSDLRTLVVEHDEPNSKFQLDDSLCETEPTLACQEAARINSLTSINLDLAPSFGNQAPEWMYGLDEAEDSLHVSYTSETDSWSGTSGARDSLLSDSEKCMWSIPNDSSEFNAKDTFAIDNFTRSFSQLSCESSQREDSEVPFDYEEDSI